MTLQPQRLTNGNTVYPPPKGKSVGGWVESGRQRTEIVQYIRARTGEHLVAWFYDSVDWVRMHADGTTEMDSSLEKVDGVLDVREQSTSDSACALISVGGTAARALRAEFEQMRLRTRAEPLEPPKASKPKRAVKKK